MNLTKCLLFFCCIATSTFSNAQDEKATLLLNDLAKSTADSQKVNILNNLSKYYLSSSPEKAKNYGIASMQLAEKIKYNKGLALAYKNIGLADYTLGKYAETIEYFGQSLKVYETIGDLDGKAMILNNFGSVYYNRGEDDKALESYFKSLEVAQLLGDKTRIATALSNIGNVYHNKTATKHQALEYFLRSLKLAEELKDKNVIGGASVNIGEVYQEMNKDDSAIYYFRKSLDAYKNTVDISYPLNDMGNVYEKKRDYRNALKFHNLAYVTAKQFDSKLDMAQSQLGLGRTYLKLSEFPKALNSFMEAQEISLDISSSKELDSAFAGLATSYSYLKDFSNAYKFQKLYSNLADTLNNLTLAEKLSSLEIQQRQSQINLLTKDKALQSLALERQKLIKNSFAVGLTLIIFITVIIYRNYRSKVKTNLLLDKQKDQIEHLLLNILPAEIAAELQNKGIASPRYYDSVSVLFTDFKGFTRIADRLSPQDVVSELNDCFIAFDDIIEKYGLEKIKTIGDAYMCAGGIPASDPDHSLKMIKAGIEIRDFMQNRNQIRIEKQEEPLEIRIGIHVGPIVAGVVGRKKYAYDIWGSTVNIASRMESNGEVGQINISAETYHFIKEFYNCTYRGKIYAKNIGEIDMYFVSNLKEENYLNSDVFLNNDSLN
jgi:class 3 adenylate cyclase